MKDILLKIIRGGVELEPGENYHTFNEDRVASEIADMVEAFIEWIVWDENFLPFKKGGEIFWRDKDDN